MKKRVLVTGATSGLGERAAHRLADAGWHVIVGGRREGAVAALVADIEAKGGEASSFIADLSDLEGVRRALDAHDWPELHGIVANAGAMLKLRASMAPALVEPNMMASTIVNCAMRICTIMTSPIRALIVNWENCSQNLNNIFHNITRWLFYSKVVLPQVKIPGRRTA